MIRYGLAVCAALAICCSLGCESREPTYITKGQVVYKEDGKPFPGGTMIWFESTKGPDYTRSMSTLDDQGKFVLSTDREGNGAIAGTHRVRISAENSEGMNLSSKLSKLIDPKYFEFATSGITVEIKEGVENDLKIEVERPR